MKKVALLTKTVLFTRVIIEVPDDFDESSDKELWWGKDSPFTDENMNEIEEKVYLNLIDKIRIEGVIDNIDAVWNDKECPYDEWDE